MNYVRENLSRNLMANSSAMPNDSLLSNSQISSNQKSFELILHIEDNRLLNTISIIDCIIIVIGTLGSNIKSKTCWFFLFILLFHKMNSQVLMRMHGAPDRHLCNIDVSRWFIITIDWFKVNINNGNSPWIIVTYYNTNDLSGALTIKFMFSSSVQAGTNCCPNSL